MKQTIVIIGMGEMGGVYARRFWRNGYPVYPKIREIYTQHSRPQS